MGRLKKILAWLTPRRSHEMGECTPKVEKLHVPELIFEGEQDGPIERVLKKELVMLLANNPAVRTAYLAKVSFGSDAPGGVALCIKATTNSDMQLVKNVQTIFASLFNRNCRLDILFMTSDHEKQVAAVCLPFYNRLTN